jgi:DNA gyrase subunit A
VLFFSSRGRSTRRRSGGCRSAPAGAGKALVNMLPLQQGERITTIMPLPEDEATWDRST